VTNPGTLDDVALFRQIPELRGRVPWARLGDWPTPIEPLDVGGVTDVYVKREDISSSIYGGNKIRTLEAIFGAAVNEGAERIWATGAYGSNHAVATVLHAKTAGLTAGAALWPQPRSTPARENLSATLSARPALENMSTVIQLPFTMAALRRRARRAGRPAFVMAPGGATPQGAFGALSAAFELVEQMARGDCPAFRRVVIAVGSTCTTAGMLAGFHLARERGLIDRIPAITGVRVTPWPVTSAALILRLALATVRRFARISRQPTAITYPRLAGTLHVETRFFGGGYGQATATGHRATATFARNGGPPLDVVYSAKSGAAVIDLAHRGASGPLLYWATKSSAPLPQATEDDIDRAPRAMAKWLGRR
jgi:D-cysteine desulfhydrase